MTEIEHAIHNACDKIGARPPKITYYANCSAVRVRNGDGLPVLITLDHHATPETVSQKIAQAFKVKAENQPSDEALRKLAGK